MDLRQLAALTAVADHQSFSAAAKALHTVQSNISTHVARLEKELGAPLVDRSTGELTEVGELVVERARRVHAELEALSADVASTLGDLSGSVRLGTIGTTGRWLIPPLLRTLHDAHPKVHVVVVDATTTSLVPQLANGALDLAVVNLPVHDPDVEVVPLFEEDHVVVAPVDHPFAHRTDLDLAEVATEPLLLEPRGTGFREDLEVDASRAGVVLRPEAEVDGMRLLASLAFQGYGVAVLPASAVQRTDDEAWKAVPITGTTPRSVGLATSRRARLSAAARAVHEAIVAVVHADAPERPGLRAARVPAPDGEDRPPSV